MIYLPEEEREKVSTIVTDHKYEEKYMVVLNGGWENVEYQDGGVGFFNAPKEIKEYVKKAVKVEYF